MGDEDQVIRWFAILPLALEGCSLQGMISDAYGHPGAYSGTDVATIRLQSPDGEVVAKRYFPVSGPNRPDERYLNRRWPVYVSLNDHLVVALNLDDNSAKMALAAAELREDNQIDLTDPDAPEVRDWSKARRGQLFRPLKQPVTIRLDADLVAWFKDQGDRYQTRINAALREYVERHG